MPVWITDLAPECIECIRRALTNPNARVNEEWNEVDHDVYPPNVERVTKDRMRALSGCRTYDRVVKRETGPLNEENSQHIVESTLDLYFKCEE